MKPLLTFAGLHLIHLLSSQHMPFYHDRVIFYVLPVHWCFMVLSIKFVCTNKDIILTSYVLNTYFKMVSFFFDLQYVKEAFPFLASRWLDRIKQNKPAWLDKLLSFSVLFDSVCITLVNRRYLYISNNRIGLVLFPWRICEHFRPTIQSSASV